MSADDDGPGPLTNINSEHGLDGTFLLYDIKATSDALRNHDWASLGLIAVADGLDLAATVSDPIGSLIAAGLGFLIDHIQPLKGWLDDLAGDPAGVEAYSERWEEVAQDLDGEIANLRTRVHTDLAHMEGDAITAYMAYIERLTATIEGLKEGAEGLASSLKYAAVIVEAVRGLVRDTISQLVGAAISWASEEVFSLGLATPWVIEQVETRVASLAGRVGSTVRELVSSCRELESLVSKLDHGVGEIREGLEHLHPGAARGRHTTPWMTEPKTTVSGVGKHAGDGVPLSERLKDVGKTEVPRDAAGEGGAAGANGAAGDDGSDQESESPAPAHAR